MSVSVAPVMAQQLKAAGAEVQGMFTNDIVGSSRADDGERDRRTIRLFAEGVPTAETPAEANVRRAVGGENDSPARQLARFAEDVAGNDATGMRIRVIYRRDRYLRGGDQISFLQQGYPAARFTEPNEDFAHQHQDVRVENGVLFGDLPQFCDFAFIAGVARVSPTTRPCCGTAAPSRIWPVTRWCGGRPPHHGGLTSSTSATPPRSPSICRRTTSSSAYGPSTPKATAARSPSPARHRDRGG
jgi:hypothetical protein